MIYSSSLKNGTKYDLHKNYLWNITNYVWKWTRIFCEHGLEYLGVQSLKTWEIAAQLESKDWLMIIRIRWVDN